MDRTGFAGVGRQLVFVVLGAIALLWPAMLNGGAFWFPDSTNYVRSADAAVVFLTGQRSEWSDRIVVKKEAKKETGRSEVPQNGMRERLAPTRPVYTGRSIYYGFLLYIPLTLFGAWGAVVLQSIIASGVLCYSGQVLYRCLNVTSLKSFFLTYILLVLATPLPFYVSMMMPDVYGGLLIIVMAILIGLHVKLKARERLFLLFLSALFVTFHSTYILIAAAMGGGAFLIAVVRRRSARAALMAVPVLLTGVISIVAFNYAVQAALSEKPISPPFLSARVIATGPGFSYLQQNCERGVQPFLLCRFKDRLPMPHDSFLWDEDPRTGLFQTVSREDQAEIARQDKRFYLATWIFDPVESARAAVSSGIEQFISFGLDTFNYPEERIEKLSGKYPADIATGILGTRAAHGEMPVLATVWLTVLSTGIGLLVIAVSAVAARKRGKWTKGFWGFAALVVLGVLANAAICGALSGPKARYQMRLIWVIPFTAALAVGHSHRSVVRTRAQAGVSGDST